MVSMPIIRLVSTWFCLNIHIHSLEYYLYLRPSKKSKKISRPKQTSTSASTLASASVVSAPANGGGADENKQVTKRQKLDAAKPASAMSTVSDDSFAVLDVHRNCVNGICLALNSGDPEDYKNAISQYTDPDMIFYYKWMGEQIFVTNSFLKEATIRSRKEFFLFWESRVACMPDLTFKWHLPVKYQQRSDGGITAYVNVLMSGTKIAEMKNVLNSSTSSANPSNPSSEISFQIFDVAAKPHPDAAGILKGIDADAAIWAVVTAAAAQKQQAPADCDVNGRAGSKKSSNTTLLSSSSSSSSSLFPLSLSSDQSRGGFFEGTKVLMAKKMKLDSRLTLSFHFDKMSNKLFEIDMLRTNI